MISYREILRLNANDFSNRSIALSCACSRNTVASVLAEAKKKDLTWPLEDNVDDVFLQQLLFPTKGKSEVRKPPDLVYLYKEMAKPSVTLSLLWHEYDHICRQSKEIPYSYRQFCRVYEKYVHSQKATMRIKHKPAEAMEVDWAGKTAQIKDPISGEIIPAYVFVAVLPCSHFAYVEAFPTMKTVPWIQAHIHAFEYFKGVPRIVIPDNLKTGVVKAKSFDPVLHRTYQEMAEHYNTAIIPARVRHPKDKPTVEGSVGGISTWIIASLRNHTCFSFEELNKEIYFKLIDYNEKPFQKKEGSRRSTFLEEEAFALLPLPASRYEIASWKKATVPYDYHIIVDKMSYSVPYEYIKHEVEIRMTQTVVEVFYHSFRIASHRRIIGKIGQLSTVPEHMPEDHQNYLNWNKDYYQDWAKITGASISITVERLFNSYKTEKQALKACMTLMKWSNQYSPILLEKACQKGLTYSPVPNIQTIKTILTVRQEKEKDLTTNKNRTTTAATHSFTRGSDYYRRKK